MQCTWLLHRHMTRTAAGNKPAMDNLMLAVIIIIGTIVAGSVADDSRYVGCDNYDPGTVFNKTVDGWKLPNGEGVSHTSAESCIEICFTWNYTYAGMNSANSCYCAKTLTKNVSCSDAGGSKFVRAYRSVPGNALYRGCYKDNDDSWVPYDMSANHTISSCIALCQRHGYLYAALRNGDLCQCANRGFTEDDQRSDQCNATCTLAFGEICGGSSVTDKRLSVYKTNGSAAAYPANTSYIGCYEERSLNLTKSVQHVTNELSCITECLTSESKTSQMYKYAAYQKNGDCSCMYALQWRNMTSTDPDNCRTWICNGTTSCPFLLYHVDGTKVQSITASTTDSTTQTRSSSTVTTSATSRKDAMTDTSTHTTTASKEQTTTAAATMTFIPESSSSTSASTTMTTSWTTSKSPSTGASSTLSQTKKIIIGVVVGVGLFLILLALVLMLLIINRRKLFQEKPGLSCHKLSCLPKGSHKVKMVEEKYSNPYQVEEFYGSIREELEKEAPFQAEFLSIPNGFRSKADVGKRTANYKTKNRFGNIIPYDNSRVVLKTIDGDVNSDYINASFIKNYHEKKTFIAAQGPKEETLIDFWRMVWQENVPVIVMLTELLESSATKNKCAQYWPSASEHSALFRDIKVTLRSEEKYPSYTFRNFHVEKDEEHKTVVQYQYTDWPDHDAPETPSSLINFYNDVQCHTDPGVGPAIVHCTAGVGRSGTFIAYDCLLDQARHEDKVDVKACVHSLRNQRVNMIQTPVQYSFLHAILAQTLTLGNTQIPIQNYVEYYKSILLPERGTKTKLAIQYDMLEDTKLKFDRPEISDGLKEENLEKNRLADVIPRNKHRPAIGAAYQLESGYINAVAVDNYNKKQAFFVTQLPFHQTRTDLWCLVFDFAISVVLSLDSVEEEDLYWPTTEGEKLTFGYFTVSCKSAEEVQSYITKYCLELQNGDEARQVTLLSLSWQTEDVGPAEDMLIVNKVVKGLTKTQSDGNNNQCVLVQCTSGYERSGLYCAVSFLMEMIKCEKKVDIYQCVQTLRTRRPQFIKSVSQYKFLHDAVKVHLASRGE